MKATSVNKHGEPLPMDYISNASKSSAKFMQQANTVESSMVTIYLSDQSTSFHLSDYHNSQELSVEVQIAEHGLFSENFSDLQTYMAFINFASVSNYLRWLPGWLTFKALRTFGKLQKAFWLMIVLIASINGTLFVKDAVLRVQTEHRSRPVYIILGNLVTQLALSLNFLYGMIFRSHILKGLFESRNYKIIEGNDKKGFSKVSRTAIFLNVTSFVIAAIACLLGLGVVAVSKWSFRRIVEVHYDEIYTGFSKWREEEANKTFVKNKLTGADIGHHEHPNQHKVAFASIGFLSDWAIMIIIFCIGDLFVLVTCLLKTEIEELNTLIEIHKHTGGGSKSTEMCKNIFTFYKSIVELSKELNHIFGTTFKLYHGCNLFLTVYLLHAFVTARDLGGTIIISLKLSKGLIGYYNAVLITSRLGAFRMFVHKEKNQQILNIDALAYLVMKDELELHPIGIGNGSFLINELFLRQFFIMAVTFFFILIDEVESSRFY